MRFRFSRSHPYPGAVVSVIDDPPQGSNCVIEFGDGVVIVAGARTDGDAHLLDIPAYRTARGSNVGPSEWRVARSPRGGWRAHPRR